jgi:predicted transcriptional regulator
MKPKQKPELELSRRERQIMNAIYRLGEATIAEIATELPNPPSNDAVRRTAHILEGKGFLKHRQDGPRNVFSPTMQPEKASHTALDQVIDTFFGGSSDRLVAALLDLKGEELDNEDLNRLSNLIESARNRGESS